jgi:hypothetical protein
MMRFLFSLGLSSIDVGRVIAGRSTMRSPATAALAVVLGLVLLSSSTAHAKLTNVVTDWVNATQTSVATDGLMNQLASRCIPCQLAAVPWLVCMGDVA